MNKTHSYLKKWHEGLISNDPKLLDDILDESCVFTSPIVFKPIEGKEMSKLYLMGAGQTFDMDRFEYVRELVDGLDSVLEFETYIGDISVNGVDIIRWNDDFFMNFVSLDFPKIVDEAAKRTKTLFFRQSAFFPP